MTSKVADDMRFTTASERKHAAIVEAARTVFIRDGYLGASLDEVAQLAAVSKRTVYKHFGDKDSLFVEVLVGAIGPMDTIVRGALAQFDEQEPIERQLRTIARTLIDVVVTPEVMQLRRIVIAEARRFPQVAEAWRTEGPGRNVHTLAGYFRELADAGELACPDPDRAAEHFNWLVLGAPINTHMFAPDTGFSGEALHDMADDAARVFLTAYRPTERS